MRRNRRLRVSWHVSPRGNPRARCGESSTQRGLAGQLLPAAARTGPTALGTACAAPRARSPAGPVGSLERREDTKAPLHRENMVTRKPPPPLPGQALRPHSYGLAPSPPNLRRPRSARALPSNFARRRGGPGAEAPPTPARPAGWAPPPRGGGWGGRRRSSGFAATGLGRGPGFGSRSGAVVGGHWRGPAPSARRAPSAREPLAAEVTWGPVRSLFESVPGRTSRSPLFGHRRGGGSCKGAVVERPRARGTGAEGAARGLRLGPGCGGRRPPARLFFFSFPPIWQRRAAAGPRRGLEGAAEAIAAGRCTCSTGARRSRSRATGWCRSESARTTRDSASPCARCAAGRGGMRGQSWGRERDGEPKFLAPGHKPVTGAGPAASGPPSSRAPAAISVA